MNVQINYRVINPEFNKKYADEYHGGKESESNWKYLQTVCLGVDNVQSVSVVENEPFILKGAFEEINQPFEFAIPNVSILRCELYSGLKLDFGVSKSILNKTHQAKRTGYDVLRYYFYINSTPHSIRVGERLFLDQNDIPSEFIRSN